MTAEAMLDLIVRHAERSLPPGLTKADLADFIQRHRSSLLQTLARAFSLPTATASAPLAEDTEHWTVARRTAANLRAMRLAAALGDLAASSDERAVLAQYSGWGGLSIDAIRDQVPEGFPVPERRGLIHEYYTPAVVAREVARVVTSTWLDGLPRVAGELHALEPSAGIGRLLRAFPPGEITWHAVEYSELSGRMLAAMEPGIDLEIGSFEQWVRERGPSLAGKLGLVVANPPYGARGAALTQDPDRSYREKRAYLYFLRRSLDLLSEGGLGVYLVPAGFLTGRTAELQKAREAVLRRHHLLAAFRLPSVTPGGRDALFPGAKLVTDLLFFQARGGELAEVDPGDEAIAAGDYFREYPRHILGREGGADEGEDDQTASPRKKGRFTTYFVEGTFSRLPAFTPRASCEECAVVPWSRPTGSGSRRGQSVVRRVDAQDASTEGLSPELTRAVQLGLRLDQFLAHVAANRGDDALALWGELVQGLRDWREAHGPPHAHAGLRQLYQGGNVGAERFLTGFTRAGDLAPAVASEPEATPARWQGQKDDIPGQAEMLYRAHRVLPVSVLFSFHRNNGGLLGSREVLSLATAAGWCLAGRGDTLEPGWVYYTGDLWARVDQAEALADSPESAGLHHARLMRLGGITSAQIREQARAQVKRLMELIAPQVWEDLDGISPRQTWMGLDLINEWLNALLAEDRFDPVKLEHGSGLVLIRGWDYGEPEAGAALAPVARLVVGWLNHDKTVFKPDGGDVGDEDTDLSADQRRVELAAQWDAHFLKWVARDPARKARIVQAYNRRFRGYRPAEHDPDPLLIARWRADGPRLHPHQTVATKRVLANGGGLVAFDVGVGKTYTGIAILARARQEGWVRRPVILVPNSIVWKWHADIKRVLPDYRVGVVGSKQKVISRGPRKGFLTSETDTPLDRARTWSGFQAGEYDVVLLTYSMLGRTRMNEDAVREYVSGVQAIQREVKLRQRNLKAGKKRGDLTERDKAIMEEGVSAWVAQQMELGEKEEYDPGIAWDDLGVDMLIVDEAQNFKNLYKPEAREGGVPRFMGSSGDGSDRAWQLDFRCAAIRGRTGGRGVVLLSATPAKNSPLEFYNLIQYIDPGAWTRAGIGDPEQFIDRYLRIELRDVLDSKMVVKTAGAVTGFQNLGELRDIIFRYGDFKTAEEVGIVLPSPQVEIVEVDLDDRQEQKYSKLVDEIAAAAGQKAKAGKILGLLARLALIAIHADLDAKFDWKTADSVDDPSSPKLEALATRILANRHCGHIVFVDNVAAHRWVASVLVAHGIPEKRIAFLNAKAAKATADRQRIAGAFNGDPENGVAPLYDVVIANAIAYEGVDLQTRTCAIHHLDLPWEPATLQQRNGRGVRQGNKLETIAIYYYFARRSLDGLRFNMIQGKRGWMTQLLTSQDRDTNNPGAQSALSPEDMLLLISRNPDETRAKLEKVKAQRAKEARQRAAREATRLLDTINSRFRVAERSTDADEAARLRSEAETRLAALARVDAAAWPWTQQALAVRDHSVFSLNHAPVYTGLRLTLRPDDFDGERLVEIGRGNYAYVAYREAGDALWRETDSWSDGWDRITPESYRTSWPADDLARVMVRVKAVAKDLSWDLKALQVLRWDRAPPGWVDRLWPAAGRVLLDGLAAANEHMQPDILLPTVVGDMLTIRDGRAVKAEHLTVLPPSDTGWDRFLELAPRSELTYAELNAAAFYWWNQRFPRGLLAAARREANNSLSDEEEAA